MHLRPGDEIQSHTVCILNQSLYLFKMCPLANWNVFCFVSNKNINTVFESILSFQYLSQSIYLIIIIIINIIIIGQFIKLWFYYLLLKKTPRYSFKSRYCQPNMFRGCSGRGSTSSSVSTVSGIDCKHVCQVQLTVSPSIIQERNASLRSPFPSHKHKPVSFSSVFSTLYKLYSFPAANDRYPDHSCRRGCCYRNSGTQGRQTDRKMSIRLLPEETWFSLQNKSGSHRKGDPKLRKNKRK